MKKYVIVKTGEEVKIGDIIGYTYSKNTSFGELTYSCSFTLREEDVEDLIAKGILKVKRDGASSKIYTKDPHLDTTKEDDISYFIDKLATKYGCSDIELTEWLDRTNKIAPKAVLDLLLTAIAESFRYKDLKGFALSEKFYTISPIDGAVIEVTNKKAKYVPLFKSIREAIRAKEILKTQIELMYGEQKSN